MSDASVKNALRSKARLVVIEAPAGCGKTYQGASYACHAAPLIGDGRVLILTHTHAACGVFASRSKGVGGRIEVHTIDSLIVRIAAVYHQSINIPADAGGWARNQPNGYALLADKVARLLQSSSIVSRALASRYPIVICDEHQDASNSQETVIMSLLENGSFVRIFGDPMQRIFGGRRRAAVEEDRKRWADLTKKADRFEKLDVPRRWENGSRELGEWILQAREKLAAGDAIVLRSPLPPGVTFIVAENVSQKPGGYQLQAGVSKPIYDTEKRATALLVLAAHRETVHALRAFFGRRLLIWEGHVRDHLAPFASAMKEHKGNCPEIARATVTFIQSVATGFTSTAYSARLLSEIASGCTRQCHGKPSMLQALAKNILNNADHKGAANLLRKLDELRKTDRSFNDIHIDYQREFWDAVKLGEFEDSEDGFSDISRRRSYTHAPLPEKAISTIHKAKGLECSDVLIVPCDAKHFGDSHEARCKLYVAMSRAQRSVTFVVSSEDPSPLISVIS